MNPQWLLQIQSVCEWDRQDNIAKIKAIFSFQPQMTNFRPIDVNLWCRYTVCSFYAGCDDSDSDNKGQVKACWDRHSPYLAEHTVSSHLKTCKCVNDVYTFISTYQGTRPTGRRISGVKCKDSDKTLDITKMQVLLFCTTIMWLPQRQKLGAGRYPLCRS